MDFCEIQKAGSAGPVLALYMMQKVPIQPVWGAVDVVLVTPWSATLVDCSSRLGVCKRLRSKLLNMKIRITFHAMMHSELLTLRWGLREIIVGSSNR